MRIFYFLIFLISLIFSNNLFANKDILLKKELNEVREIYIKVSNSEFNLPKFIVIQFPESNNNENTNNKLLIKTYYDQCSIGAADKVFHNYNFEEFSWETNRQTSAKLGYHVSNFNYYIHKIDLKNKKYENYHIGTETADNGFNTYFQNEYNSSGTVKTSSIEIISPIHEGFQALNPPIRVC